MMVTKLRVGPHNREPHAWNRQLLMMRRIPHLFPCLQEIDFDQVPNLPSHSTASHPHACWASREGSPLLIEWAVDRKL
jgi:hypothetical protein